MVDVDDLTGEGVDEAAAEDLHVAREDDGIDVFGAEEFEFGAFLIGFGVGGDGEVVEGDIEAIGDGFE